MSPELRLRRAGNADATAIASVLREAFADFEPAYTSAAFAATTPGATEIEQRLAEGPIWVTELEDRIIGTISAVAGAEGVYVRGMAIAPSARRRGVGKMLLEKAELFAQANGAKRIYLSTTPFLSAAIQLYEAAGFVRSSAAPHDLFGTPLFTMDKAVEGR